MFGIDTDLLLFLHMWLQRKNDVPYRRGRICIHAPPLEMGIDISQTSRLFCVYTHYYATQLYNITLASSSYSEQLLSEIDLDVDFLTTL